MSKALSKAFSKAFSKDRKSVLRIGVTMRVTWFHWNGVSWALPKACAMAPTEVHAVAKVSTGCYK